MKAVEGFTQHTDAVLACLPVGVDVNTKYLIGECRGRHNGNGYNEVIRIDAILGLDVAGIQRVVSIRPMNGSDLESVGQLEVEDCRSWGLAFRAATGCVCTGEIMQRAPE